MLWSLWICFDKRYCEVIKLLVRTLMILLTKFCTAPLCRHGTKHERSNALFAFFTVELEESASTLPTWKQIRAKWVRVLWRKESDLYSFQSNRTKLWVHCGFENRYKKSPVTWAKRMRSLWHDLEPLYTKLIYWQPISCTFTVI